MTLDEYEIKVIQDGLTLIHSVRKAIAAKTTGFDKGPQLLAELEQCETELLTRWEVLTRV